MMGNHLHPPTLGCDATRGRAGLRLVKAPPALGVFLKRPELRLAPKKTVLVF